jgi:hypothetical protein
MLVKPIYFFEPRNGQQEKSFDTPEKLLEYIKNYDYLREYNRDNKLTGCVTYGKIKSFSVSAYLDFKIAEFPLKSPLCYRCVFYIGQSAVKTNNGVQVTALHHPATIQQGVREKYTVNTQDCVIDSENLKQIYPSAKNFEESKLGQWIKQIESMKYNIQKVK